MEHSKNFKTIMIISSGMSVEYASQLVAGLPQKSIRKLQGKITNNECFS